MRIKKCVIRYYTYYHFGKISITCCLPRIMYYTYYTHRAYYTALQGRICYRCPGLNITKYTYSTYYTVYVLPILDFSIEIHSKYD